MFLGAKTRCLPLYVTVVKSFSATHPFAGCASGPVEVHRYVDGRAHELGVPDRPVHFWLPAPVQFQSCTAVPLAVLPPATSRHSPDSTPTTVPSAFTRHCWLAPPVQSQICRRVPSVWLAPGTSRHRPEPVPRNAPLVAA